MKWFFFQLSKIRPGRDQVPPLAKPGILHLSSVENYAQINEVKIILNIPGFTGQVLGLVWLKRFSVPVLEK